MDIGASIRISGNTTTYCIHNSKDKSSFTSGQFNGCQCICGFSTLGNCEYYIIFFDDWITITELTGIFHLHGYFAEGLKELLANQTCMPASTTSYNDKSMGVHELCPILLDSRKVDTIPDILWFNLQAFVHSLQSASHTVFKTLGLVENLFEHKVRKTALIQHIKININLCYVNIHMLCLER